MVPRVTMDWERGWSWPKPGSEPSAAKRSVRTAVAGYATVTAATGG